MVLHRKPLGFLVIIMITYMDCRGMFEETQLPPKRQFHSHEMKESVSEDDYVHAQRVWKEFNLQNIRQYHDLYLTLNLLPLADVLENFLRMSLNYYELDPCHNYTLPGLSFDACLKITKIELKLLLLVEFEEECPS